MCSQEASTFRDFVFCQNPELSDTIDYVLQDDQTKAAEEIVKTSCGPPTEGQQLPTVQGTAIIQSFEESRQARDDAAIERRNVQESLIDDTTVDKTVEEHHKRRPPRHPESEYEEAESYLQKKPSITEDDVSHVIAKKKTRKKTKKKKDKSKPVPEEAYSHHKHHSHSHHGSHPTSSRKERERTKRDSDEQQFVVQDKDDLSLVKHMIHKYDKESARAAPNIELHKVFENEEFITFRKVAQTNRSQEKRDFGGYDETEVRIEQGSTTTSSENGPGSPMSRVPHQVMIVISKKKLRK